MEPDIREIEIIEKTAGIDLDDLGLSVRLYNCLRRSGYCTLTDVMLEKPESFSKIRNFGRTSEQELLALRNFVLASDKETIIQHCENRAGINLQNEGIETEPSDDFSVLESIFGRKLESPEVMFRNDAGDYCIDIDVREIPFSVRTMNILVTNGMDSLLKAASFRYYDLIKLRGMGRKSVNELLDVIKNKVIVNEANEEVDGELISEAIIKVEDFFSPIIDSTDLENKRKELGAVILQVCGPNENEMVLSEEVMADIAKSNPIRQQLKQLVLSAVSDKIYYGIDKRTLITVVSNQNAAFYAIFDEIIESMISDNQIRIISGKVYRYKAFLNEWINTLEGNSRITLECRCQGMTLEETGEKLGLTRERVRQVVAKTLKRRPKIYEDDYKEFIEKYYFTKEEFESLFNLAREQVNYLLLSYKRGSGDVQTFLDDSSIPAHLKERVAIAFRGKVLVLDGECVPLKRDVLLQKLLKTFYADKECSVEEFAEFYIDLLRENNVLDYENLLFPNRRALEARISDYPYTISKTGHKIRYYDTEAVDINELLVALDIGRYADTEISTLKLMRDWPEVMEQYDIRDEYELHNLIRKRLADIRHYDISVTRMPFITVGSGDRIKQVEDLLLQLAPVTNTDLAAEYEERYGVRSETVLANFFKCIDVFYHDGIFDLELQELSPEDYAAVKAELKENFYLWDSIVKIYNRVSNNPNPEAINAMTLKKLGFRVYSQYVVSSNYPSADAFFTELLLKERNIDLEELPHGVRSIQAYYSVLTELRDRLELVEVEKDVFYRFDYFAERYHVDSKESLFKLGADIISGLESTEYFSVDSIASDGLRFLDLGLARNPYILNSIIRVQPDIKTSRIANTYIATKKENDLSQIGLITYIIKTNGEMSTDALIDLLQTRYCLRLEKSRVVYVVEGSDAVVHDTIFDYVCDRAKWNGYEGPVYLPETRFAKQIEERRDSIEHSDVLIAKVFWRDKYSEFVDYCGMNDCFEMKDILKLDFAKLYDNACHLNISRGTIADVARMFLEWTDNLSVNDSAEQESESILDLFFK